MKIVALLFFFFITHFGAMAEESIYSRCAKEANESQLVYADIFSVIIDIKATTNPTFHQVMQRLNDGSLQIIEWDIRGDNEIRAFVTWPSGGRVKGSEQTLDYLNSTEGLRALCVSRAIRF